MSGINSNNEQVVFPVFDDLVLGCLLRGLCYACALRRQSIPGEIEDETEGYKQCI